MDTGILLNELREDYRRAELSEAFCDTNPIRQFESWFKEAKACDLKEPNAMTLATATVDGRPSARIVLLKEVTDDGFVFYTNYESRKGQELKTNPRCALIFYWAELERQVRVEGRVNTVSQEKTEAYFRRRPRASRLGALASQQSELVPNRRMLEEKMAELEEKYAGTEDIPVPAYWGGFLVTPEVIEFWQGRTSRLHDRIVYWRTGTKEWRMGRLSP